MSSLKDNISALSSEQFTLDTITIRPIQDDYDLWFAVVECKLSPEQENFVNPAGFSIGRAFLNPEDNVPCIIWKDDVRIGYIVFRRWIGSYANSWSYFIDQGYQMQGYGKTAAKLAIQILKAAEPSVTIKLSAEPNNTKAQRLYRAIGFTHKGETDGNDLVFEI